MKEAYLIVAHGQWDMVIKLMSFIDNKENDIYLHINALVEKPDDEIFNVLKNSRVFFVKRYPIVWGDYGYMQCIFSFFKQAHKIKYDYYHLLSGVDLPLTDNERLKEFLDKNKFNNNSNGMMTNYLNCHLPYNVAEYYPVQQYNLFIKYWRSPNKIVRKFFKGIALALNMLQHRMGINRIKNIDMILYKGDAFFSFGNEFVEYILTKEEWARTYFGKYSFAPEEYIFQTLLMNSIFRNTLFCPEDNRMTPNLRHIDFKRGTPWIWTINDLEELNTTGDFFARKFDPKVDTEIIEFMYHKLSMLSE